jgi:hypothetical protein
VVLAALLAAALEASRPVRSDPELAVEAEEGACTDHRPAKQTYPAETALPPWQIAPSRQRIVGSFDHPT